MNDLQLNKTDLILLREAYKRPQGIPTWLLTSKLGLSLKEAALSFRRLRDIGFVGEKDGNLRILALGRNWLLANQDRFAFSGEKTWRNVPERFKASTIAANAPYAPRVSLLDKSHFVFGGKKQP